MSEATMIYYGRRQRDASRIASRESIVSSVRHSESRNQPLTMPKPIEVRSVEKLPVNQSAKLTRSRWSNSPPRNSAAGRASFSNGDFARWYESLRFALVQFTSAIYPPLHLCRKNESGRETQLWKQS
jgi:hypothetical protein